MDLHEHFSRLQVLLKIEREEDRKQYFQKIRNRSIDDRKKDGVCWYPVEIRKSYLGLGEKWVLDITRTSAQGTRHMFQAGSSASIFLNDGKEGKMSTGIVSRVVDDKITIMLNREDPPGWLDEGKIGLNLLFDESTYDEMDRTLAKLRKTDRGRAYELIRILEGLEGPRFGSAYDIKYPHLNESQNAALGKIRAAQDVALVHGPPGTGKTTTMVQAIKETVDEEKHVLVCAPSNAAVDLIVEKLHELEVNVVRLGHPARVTDSVVSHTLDAQLATHPDARMLKDIRKKSEEMRRLGKKYKRNYGRAEAAQRKMLLKEARQLKDEALMLEDHMIYDVLNNASVIACTLVGANNQFLFNRTFKTVFIDESSQALEPAAWIPILKANRVVMAGDHLQLPPTVKSKEAAREGLGETLFERVIRTHNADTMLKVQYRMHPDIMSFSNGYFYRDQLTSADFIADRKGLYARALEFIDTAGCGFDEAINEETLSTYNTEEARLCLDHLSKSLKEKKFETTPTIGIIAPYKAQVETLRKLMQDFEWEEGQLQRLAINTVDAFQGQERDIMYITLTRSNPEGEIGFLADERRLNVGLTRARHRMVVLGNSATLSSNAFFDKLIVHFQELGSYSSAFEYIY